LDTVSTNKPEQNELKHCINLGSHASQTKTELSTLLLLGLGRMLLRKRNRQLSRPDPSGFIATGEVVNKKA
jgi:hypothetical protein